MDSKKSGSPLPDPYLIDEVNQPLNDEEIKGLRPAEEYFAKYGGLPPAPPIPVDNGKVMVTLDLDPRIIDHFKGEGDWWAKINEALLDIVKRSEKASKKAS